MCVCVCCLGGSSRSIEVKHGIPLTNTEIESDIVGEMDREFDILFVSDNDRLAVLPGEGESVLLVV